MPLRKGSSNATIAANIKELIASGKSQRQAVAIALSMSEEAKVEKRKKAMKQESVATSTLKRVINEANEDVENRVHKHLVNAHKYEAAHEMLRQTGTTNPYELGGLKDKAKHHRKQAEYLYSMFMRPYIGFGFPYYCEHAYDQHCGDMQNCMHAQNPTTNGAVNDPNQAGVVANASGGDSGGAAGGGGAAGA